jgi:hypothetical protein
MRAGRRRLRWLWIDRPAGLLALVAAAVAIWRLLLPVATTPDAPDALLGVAQLAWLGLSLLLPAAAGLGLLRLVRRARRA